MSLLQLSGVDKSVRLPTGDMLQILYGVDLQIAQGEHVAIVGRSGSGKSTLLNVLGLLDNPSRGEYLLEGRPVGGLSGKQRSDLRGRTFGFVFQQFNLLPRRSAVENAAVPLLYSRRESFWRRNSLAREVLTQVGLGERLEARPEQLSGGEQQRVAIARALVRQPRIILADEPTGSLDVDTGAVVMDLLEQVCAERGATLITITHDLAVAARAQRRYRLEHGVLTLEDPDRELAAPETAAVPTVQPPQPSPVPALDETSLIAPIGGPTDDTDLLPVQEEESTEELASVPEPEMAPPPNQGPLPNQEPLPAKVFPATPSLQKNPRPEVETSGWERPEEQAPESTHPEPPPEAAGRRRPKTPRRRRILPTRIRSRQQEQRPPLDEELYELGGADE